MKKTRPSLLALLLLVPLVLFVTEFVIYFPFTYRTLDRAGRTKLVKGPDELAVTITGDITSVTSLSAGLPTALVDARFSREFEVEADDAAVEYLHGKRIPLSRYADILARLEQDHQRRAGEGEDRKKEIGRAHV